MVLTISLSLSAHIGWCPGNAVVYRSLTITHRYTRGQFEHEDTLADAEPPTCAEDSECETTRSPLDLPLHKHSCIDNEYTDQTRNPKVPTTVIRPVCVCLLSR